MVRKKVMPGAPVKGPNGWPFELAPKTRGWADGYGLLRRSPVRSYDAADRATYDRMYAYGQARRRADIARTGCGEGFLVRARKDGVLSWQEVTGE